MRVLGIDCGGSHVSCGLIEGGKILTQQEISTGSRSFREILPALTAMIRDVCAKSSVEIQTCSGIGLGLPVILDAGTGEILSTLDKFTDLAEIDLVSWSDREFGLPIRIENDARMALLGEHFAGAAGGAEDVVMITLGTGIGCAAMLQGRLLHSRFGQAGCVGGHISVNLIGRRCKCGAVGCAEAEASTSVLAQICREWPDFDTSSLAQADLMNFETLFRAKDAGDVVAAQVFQHCCEVWSSLTVSLIHAYGPELILFGGSVMRRGQEILDPIRAYVAAHMWRTVRGVPRIELASLGNDAALLGAAALFTGRGD